MKAKSKNLLKAIPCEFGGVTFRSRLEARWAIFFEKLGLAWEFEPQGYAFDGERYLPDFYLGDLGIYIEVKPEMPDQVYYEKLCLFQVRIGKPVFIVIGPPTLRDNLIRCNDKIFEDKIERIEELPFWQILEDRRDAGVFWIAAEDFGVYSSIGGWGKPTQHQRLPAETARIKAASAAALSERFGT